MDDQKPHVLKAAAPKIFRAMSAACALACAWALTSCETMGGGRYGSGAGRFDTVVVDAGHGGHDRGAKACSGAPEKILTLDTAHHLADALRRSGMHVIETRPGDYFITLGQRTDASNRCSRVVFVSVHYNWAKRPKPHGIEIYYRSQRSKRLAANILQEVSRAFPTDNRGIKSHSYYVLRHNQRPAVLCELGFISNRSDNRYIQSAAMRQKIAECVAAGIMAEAADRTPR